MTVKFKSDKLLLMMNTNTTERKQTAETILAQIGGSRFVAMTGCHNFTFNSESEHVELNFRIPRYGACKIVLMPTDTYAVTFFKIRGTKINQKEFTNVYSDQLATIFESITGLRTSL